MPANKWDKCLATTDAVEKKNKNSKGFLRIDLKEALVRVYHIDKAFCLQYIAAEAVVRIRCRDSSHEVQAAAKRKQWCNKQYPKDAEALHEPPDRKSNFGKDKATRKTQITNKKTKTPKQPLNDISNDDNDFQPKNKLKSVSQKPQTDLLFTTCKELYDDGVGYDGTVCGFEYCETESVWKYKMSFSDGKTTLIALDDQEVKF